MSYAMSDTGTEDCRHGLPLVSAARLREGEARYPVIYVNGEIPIEGIVTNLVNAGVQADFLLLSIQPESWNDDFTPWAAPAFRAGRKRRRAGRMPIYPV